MREHQLLQSTDEVLKVIDGPDPIMLHLWDSFEEYQESMRRLGYPPEKYVSVLVRRGGAATIVYKQREVPNA